MIPKYTILLVEAERPIDAAVTKFGGQPVFVDADVAAQPFDRCDDVCGPSRSRPRTLFW